MIYDEYNNWSRMCHVRTFFWPNQCPQCQAYVVILVDEEQYTKYTGDGEHQQPQRNQHAGHLFARYIIIHINIAFDTENCI